MACRYTTFGKKYNRVSRVNIVFGHENYLFIIESFVNLIIVVYPKNIDIHNYHVLKRIYVYS